jgi:hypothetical protein
MRKLGLTAVILFLGGCMSSEPHIRPLRPLEIATAPYQEIASASLEGSLMYEGGCLLFHDDSTKALLMPVWPLGSSFNGTALLFHQPGKSDQWVAVNQEILLSGQPQQWTAYGAPPYEPFQRQCGGYAPFYVSTVRPAD